MNMNREETTTARSPLSALAPEQIRGLPRTFLLEQLELYYETKPPGQIVECDYSLWRCVETGLEFCWPMLPGNTAFYEWVSGFETYYPGIRWEYRGSPRRLERENFPDGKSFKVLDVGCGKGDFLRSLDWIPANANLRWISTNRRSKPVVNRVFRRVAGRSRRRWKMVF